MMLVLYPPPSGGPLGLGQYSLVPVGSEKPDPVCVSTANCVLLGRWRASWMLIAASASVTQCTHTVYHSLVFEAPTLKHVMNLTLSN